MKESQLKGLFEIYKVCNEVGVEVSRVMAYLSSTCSKVGAFFVVPLLNQKHPKGITWDTEKITEFLSNDSTFFSDESIFCF